MIPAHVGFGDLSVVLASFGAREGDLLYVLAADLNGDGVIGFSDLNIVLSAFGFNC